MTWGWDKRNVGRMLSRSRIPVRICSVAELSAWKWRCFWRYTLFKLFWNYRAIWHRLESGRQKYWKRIFVIKMGMQTSWRREKTHVDWRISQIYSPFLLFTSDWIHTSHSLAGRLWTMLAVLKKSMTYLKYCFSLAQRAVETKNGNLWGWTKSERYSLQFCSLQPPKIVLLSKLQSHVSPIILQLFSGCPDVNYPELNILINVLQLLIALYLIQHWHRWRLALAIDFTGRMLTS